MGQFSVPKQYGVCPLCELRFRGSPLSQVYVDALNKYKKERQSNQDFKEYCSLCYGIFLESEEYLSLISEKITQNGYQTTDFFLNIGLPSSYDLRNSAFEKFAQNELGLKTERVIDIKAVLRHLISHFSSRSGSFIFHKDSPIIITLDIKHSESEQDTEFLKAKSTFTPKSYYDRHMKKRVHVKESKDANKKAISKMDIQDLKDVGFYPPKLVETLPETPTLGISRTPVYIGGRYLKLIRGVSQTPHIIGNVRLAEFSVEEIIGEPIAEVLKPKSFHLAGSGREDSDVRMLGTGRPFYMQFNNCINPPASADQLKLLQDKINSNSKMVNVANLQPVTELDLNIIKAEGGEKNKTYSCLVWVSEQLDQEKMNKIAVYSNTPLTISQKTPIRVLHTRSPLTRQRTIYKMNLSHLKDNFYILELTTEGGTYIKEFVHGDLGRTVPSFSGLTNTESHIIELDVIDVDLPFPPKK